MWIPAESPIRNLLAKIEFTYVNPCRESIKENLLAKVEFTYVDPYRESDKKPLGEGRIHLCESLPESDKKHLPKDKAIFLL